MWELKSLCAIRLDARNWVEENARSSQNLFDFSSPSPASFQLSKTQKNRDSFLWIQISPWDKVCSAKNATWAEHFRRIWKDSSSTGVGVKRSVFVFRRVKLPCSFDLNLRGFVPKMLKATFHPPFSLSLSLSLAVSRFRNCSPRKVFRDQGNGQLYTW